MVWCLVSLTPARLGLGWNPEQGMDVCCVFFLANRQKSMEGNFLSIDNTVYGHGKKLELDFFGCSLIYENRCFR